MQTSHPGHDDSPLARLDGRLAAIEITVSATALFVALLTSLYTVAMRAISVPTGEWVLDLPVELLLITTIYGSGALLAGNSHLRVGFLIGRLGPWAAWVVALVGQAMVTGLCGLLTWRGLLAVEQANRAGLRQAELFNAPIAALIGVAVFGFVLWTVHAALGLARAAGARPGAARVATPGHR